MFSLLVCKEKSLEHKVIPLHCLFIWGGGESEPQSNKQCKTAGQRELFLKCPSTTSPAAFKLCDGLFVCWAFVGVAVLLFALIPGCLKNPAIQENCSNPSASIASLFLATTGNSQSLSSRHTLEIDSDLDKIRIYT